MPDWSYRTVFRPLLFRLPVQLARDLALGFMGRLGRLPGGRTIIAWMGHMTPDSRLQYHNLAPPGSLPSRVGLGCGLDLRANATPAFTQFGFGLLEIGPVSRDGAQPRLHRCEQTQSLVYDSEPSLSQSDAERWVKSLPAGSAPLVLMRLARTEEKHALDLAERFAREVDGFTVPVDWRHEVLAELTDLVGPLYLVVPANATASELEEWVERRRDVADGWIVGQPMEKDRWELGRAQVDAALETTRHLRRLLGPGPTLCQAVGIHQVEDALEAQAAGAQLVQVSSGLAFSGPGLPKRINDAHLHQLHAANAEPTAPTGRRRDPSPDPRSQKIAQYAWFWALLMGAAMFFGGVLAMVIASTRVVLPYDEAMSGLTRSQLQEINPQLLPFMTHDRVTLAGTMLCVGLIYMIFAWFGVRRGLHWAARTIVVSAMAGFFSFFSFLGFGYFDPFHAFVTALLFQMLLLIMHSDLPPRYEPEAPELTDSPRWRLAQWGQMLFVVHGGILIVAGLVITKVGMTDVFVPEDLDFMATTMDCFVEHPSLVPLIAHDRATFGGMLISCGMAVLLSALWGFRRGQAWLWWGLMLAGSAAYFATLAVHWIVGYNSLKHLMPAYGGLTLLWLGSLLSYPHLVMRDTPLETRWQRWI